MQRTALLFILAAFLLGALGGIWAQAFLLPSLASSPTFQNWQFVKDWSSKTQIIRQVQEFVVSKDEGITRMVSGATRVAVGIQSSKIGSGFIFTSDGLVVTLATLVPQGFAVEVLLGQEHFPAQVVKRDLQANLALLKVEKTGLQPSSFAQILKIVPGREVFLIGKLETPEGIQEVVNTGIIRSITPASIETTAKERVSLNGSPLFDLEGNIVGISVIDSTGTVKAIPVPVLRSFLGL